MKIKYVKPTFDVYLVTQEETISAGSGLNFGGSTNGNPEIDIDEEIEDQELYF